MLHTLHDMLHDMLQVGRSRFLIGNIDISVFSCYTRYIKFI